MNGRVAFKRLAYSIILLIAVGCSNNQKLVQKEDFIIFQLNDVYEMEAVTGGTLGGFPRVAAVLKDLRSQNPNTLTFLAGDMLSPSAIGTAEYKGRKIAGRQMVDLLNTLDWDYFTFGNHEFDIKEEDLTDRLGEMKFTLVTDNVLNSEGELFTNTTKCHIREINGIKVGVLGVTLSDFNTKYAQITPSLAAARQAASQLIDQGAEIIIAITHQGFKEDSKLAAEVPEIDLIIGGHEHVNYKLLRGADYTPITKADANAKTAFIHRVYYDRDSKKTKIESKLIFIDDSITKDENIAALTKKWKDRAFTSFKQQGFEPEKVICQSTRVLDGAEASVRSFPTGLTDLVTKGFLRAFPSAHCAIMNGGSVRIDDQLQPGTITEYDIMKISPFGGNVSLVEMNGATLIRALKQGKLNVGTGAYLQYSGISENDGNWMVDERPLDLTENYAVAITSYIVEKGDQNLDFLIYDQGLVKKKNEPDQAFFEIVVNQFKAEFPE